MTIVNRVYPGVVTPLLGTATLLETLNPEGSIADSVEFVYTLSCSVSLFAPPPLRSWRGFIQQSVDNSNWTSLGSFVSLPLGASIQNLVLPSRAVNNYYRFAVTLTDIFGNVGIVYPSNSIQLTKNNLRRDRYWDISTSFSPIVGASAFDLVFTSKGGDGAGAIPGGNASGGGGAGVIINNIPSVPTDVFFVETRMSQTECYIRRDSSSSTSNQVRAINGTNAVESPSIINGVSAPAADISGIFSAASVVENNGGVDPSTPVPDAEEFASVSGIFFIANPLYPGKPLPFPAAALDGAAGFVPNETAFPSFIPQARAFGCAGLGVTFPEGIATFGKGQSGVVEITYYE